MNLDQQLLFFFSALGAFNGLLLCIYFLFFAVPAHPSFRYLGLLLGALSIRIGKSTFYFFNPELAKIYLQIGLGGCFLIGPFLYFYIKSRTAKDQAFKPIWNYQLAALLLLYIVVGYFYPYQDHPRLWGKYFYRAINYQWLAFIIASAFHLKGVFKKVFDRKSKLSYNEMLALSVFLGVFAIWMAYYTSSFTSYIVGALSFSFVLYLSLFILFYKRQKSKKPVQPKEKYANKKILPVEAKQLQSKIKQLMSEEQLYKDSNLTLSKLAARLNVSAHLLSQFLNNNLNKSFSQFINEYRIEEAKRMLMTDSNLKMQVIAELCGFNSNSTFYTAFKKFTNTTPAEYIKQN